MINELDSLNKKAARKQGEWINFGKKLDPNILEERKIMQNNLVAKVIISLFEQFTYHKYK